MENKTVFKVGQEVYCGLIGKWGKVVSVLTANRYSVTVDFNESYQTLCYTSDGRCRGDYKPTLSLKYYEIEVTQIPPRKPYEVGDVVYDCDEKVSGKVVRIEEDSTYPIVVEFNVCRSTYTEKGFKHERDPFPRLSYTPYDYVNGGFT